MNTVQYIYLHLEGMLEFLKDTTYNSRIHLSIWQFTILKIHFV